MQTICPNCSGKGFVDALSFRDPADVIQKQCRPCKGKGWLWKFTLEEMAAALAQKTRECEEYKKSTLQLLATIKRKNRRIENDAAQVEQLGRQVAEMGRTDTTELELLACAMWAKEKCTTNFGIDIKAWINMPPEPKAQWLKLASRARTK